MNHTQSFLVKLVLWVFYSLHINTGCFQNKSVSFRFGKYGAGKYCNCTIKITILPLKAKHL